MGDEIKRLKMVLVAPQFRNGTQVLLGPSTHVYLADLTLLMILP